MSIFPCNPILSGICAAQALVCMRTGVLAQARVYKKPSQSSIQTRRACGIFTLRQKSNFCVPVCAPYYARFCHANFIRPSNK